MDFPLTYEADFGERTTCAFCTAAAISQDMQQASVGFMIWNKYSNTDVQGVWKLPVARQMPEHLRGKPSHVYTPALVELTGITLGLRMLRTMTIEPTMISHPMRNAQAVLFNLDGKAIDIALNPPETEHEATTPHLTKMARLANSELAALSSLGTTTRMEKVSETVALSEYLAVKAYQMATMSLFYGGGAGPSPIIERIPPDIYVILDRCAEQAGRRNADWWIYREV